MKTKKQFTHGFTITELIIVIIVIGILSALVIVGYGAAQAKAHDVSVASDLDVMDAAQTSYGVTGKTYYSGNGNGFDGELDFSPSEDNVIDVAINGTDYCIRGYNVNGNKDSIYNAVTKESSDGICNRLVPSTQAITDSPEAKGPLTWRQISAGYEYACGVASNFKAYCWGNNGDGQLGIGSIDAIGHFYPVAVDTSGALNNKIIKSVSAGGAHTCAITSEDLAYCWGRGSRGELGSNPSGQSSVPVPVYMGGALIGKTILAIETGDYFTCAVASDNLAYCWGANWDGELGDGLDVERDLPGLVDRSGALAGKTIKSIAVGAYHTCVIASDNLSYCWGKGENGALGNNGVVESNVPVAVSTSDVLAGKSLKSVKAGNYHTCVLDSSGQAYCWGLGDSGQLGNNTNATVNTVPVAVTTSGALGGKTILSISVGGDSEHTCAITYDHYAYCWGVNANGSVGDGTTIERHVPTLIKTDGYLTGKTILSISAGGGNNYTCAIASDNKAYCWGANSYGQLGSDPDDHTVPSPVSPIHP